MMKLLLGFAAGWWVGSRQATGQAVVPASVAGAARQAQEYARQVALTAEEQQALLAQAAKEDAARAALRAQEIAKKEASARSMGRYRGWR